MINEQAFSFLLEEYKGLRSEIEQLALRCESNQRYSLIATGAYWSWVATQYTNNLNIMHYASMIMFSVVIITFYYRWTGFCAGFERISIYIQRLELALNLPLDLGWENYLYSIPQQHKHKRLRYTERAYWRFIITANLLAAACIIVYTHI